MKRRNRRKLIRILFALLIFVLILGIAENVAENATRALRAPGVFALKHHIAPYITAEFIAEAQYDWNFSDDGLMVMPDKVGRYINVHNNIRRTVGQPSSYEHTIYLFGSSTMFSMETPDDGTIPSQLQALNHDYRMVNMGQIALSSIGELTLLKHTSFHPGDIIVFYDGEADAFTMYPGVPKPPIWCDFALLCLLWHPHAYPVDMTKVASGVADYVTNIGLAREYAEAHGAKFYHFVQPIISSKPLDDYESQTRDDLYTPDETLTLDAVYPRIEHTGIALTHILDNERAAGKEFYVDLAHVDSEANGIIAKAIYDRLELEF